MNISLPTHLSTSLPAGPSAKSANGAAASLSNIDGKSKSELRETFDTFVGETFFGQMMKSMRKSVGKPAYFNGGRAEEIFQEELDHTLAKKVAQSSTDKFSGPMFELFAMQRR